MRFDYETQGLSTTDILTLLAAPGLGRKSVGHVMKEAHCSPGGTADLIDLVSEARKTNARIKVPSESDLNLARSKVLAAEELGDREGIKTINCTNPIYPSSLRQIDDPPLVLFIKGDIACLSHPSIAVVGTREPSKYGEQSAERIAATFSEAGFTIVSGLALGCDTAAHKGCLSVNGRTVAVLAHGLDTVYPAKNLALADEILGKAGCWVSEYPPGTKSRNNYFVERDRIQSGLRKAVVVIETGIEGGTMHTVSFCKKHGRILACIEHPEKYRGMESTKGNQKLIAGGDAVSLNSKSDVDRLIERLSNLGTVSEPDSLPSDSQLPLL